MPPKTRRVTVEFPYGGLVRSAAYQSQAPYTTPDCSNVRPFDPLETRQRGGNRPGLAKSFDDEFGGGEPVQSLASVSVADDDGTIRDVLLVIAEGIIQYTDSSGDFASPLVETVLIDSQTANGFFETLGAGGADVFATWAETSGSGAIDYETEYRNSGSYSAKLTYLGGEASIKNTVTVTAEAACTLEFWTRGDGSVAGQYYIEDTTHTAAIVAKGTTGVTGTTWTKKIVEFDVPASCTSVSIYFYSPSSAGDAYFDDVRLTHRVDGDTAVLSTTKYTIPVVGLLQKFYIADRSDDDISGTEGVVTSSVLSDYSVADWTALGLDTAKDFVAIVSTQLDEMDSTRTIDYVTVDYIVLNGMEIVEGPCSYEISRTDRSGNSGYCDQRFYVTDASVDDWTKLGIVTGDVFCTDEPEAYVVTDIEPDRIWLNAAPATTSEWWTNQDDGTNLLLNPSFETVGAGPPACQSWTDNGTVVRNTTATYVYAGSASLKITTSTSYSYQDVAVTAGSQYVLIFKSYYTPVGYFQIYDNSNAADILAKTLNSVLGTQVGTWHHCGHGFTAPAGCSSVRIYFWAPGSGSAYVDDVVLINTTAHGSAGVPASPYVLFDADVSNWNEYGIDIAIDSFTYVDQTPTTYANYTPTAVSQFGLLFGTTLAGTEPFDWTVARASYEGADGLVSKPNRLSSTSHPDWTAIEFADDDSVRITRPQKTFTSGVYAIASVASEGVTLDTDEVPDGSEYVYQIGRKIQVLDPKTGVLSVLEETDGNQPLNCSILTTFRGRLVGIYKNTWFMSRINEPLDWNYGADDQDTARAMAGGVAEAGDVPDPVTAAFSHTDDYFLFACHGSTWLMRGDPASGAEIDPISHEVGIVGPDAWCHLDDGTLAFLSRAGIYLYSGGGSGYPVPFSSRPLPAQLVNVDGESNVVTMAYDFVERGIHLFRVPVGETAGEGWWIDWRGDEKTLWPVSVPATMQPFAMLAYAADPTDPKRVLLGCVDGYLREFDAGESDDDGTTLTSYVKIGPFKIGNPGDFGLLTELSGVLDEDSGDVSVGIRVGLTGEAAVDSTTDRRTLTLSASRSKVFLTRQRCSSMVLYLSATGIWALEKLVMQYEEYGRIH